MPTKQDAPDLLNKYVKSESLKRHCFSVAFVMEAYAKKYGQSPDEQEKWFISGLLHDFDFEIFPTIPEHCVEGSKILKELGYPQDIIEAILGHAQYSGVERKSIMAKCLFAVDELCGLIIAHAHVRPGKFEGMDSDSVKKAMKKKAFAAAINRDDREKGIAEVGVNKDEHFNLVISALRDKATKLGF